MDCIKTCTWLVRNSELSDVLVQSPLNSNPIQRLTAAPPLAPRVVQESLKHLLRSGKDNYYFFKEILVVQKPRVQFRAPPTARKRWI